MDPDVLDIPSIGRLAIEHVFYMLGQDPVLFSCRNESGTPYLVSCCRHPDRYILAETAPERLLDLISDRIPILDLFPPEKTLFAAWNGESFSVPATPPESAYPKAGAFLELRNRPNVLEYASRLEQEIRDA